MDRVSVWEDERVLEMDGDDGCPMRMHLRPRNRTLKSGYDGKFYVVFTTVKKMVLGKDKHHLCSHLISQSKLRS